MNNNNQISNVSELHKVLKCQSVQKLSCKGIKMSTPDSLSLMRASSPLKNLRLAVFVGISVMLSGAISAQTTNLAQAPLLTLKTAPGLVMLTMGRDLPLSKAAYNDVNDLDGDGNPDLFFKPGFRYEGYFAYDRCYSYGSGVFNPIALGDVVKPNASDRSKDYYTCASQPKASRWSGNFLNWMTMSRLDVLRKVLFGGKRSTDLTTTILERSYIPQDATIWGKEYLSVANDGYDIRDYTPLALPTPAGRRHQFANVTKLDGNSNYTLSASLNDPQLVVYQNQTIRLWDLVATERRILGITPIGAGGLGPFTVRVATCVLINGKYEDWCSLYPRTAATGTTYKPTGLLHKYGESKSLAFGLLSGSYDNNYSGGVLRQNIDDFNQEIVASSGRYTAVKGIVYHLNELRPWGFGNANSEWDCGFFFASQRTNGACMMWGNPLGEMMYESLRYFSGASGGTPAYRAGVGTATRIIDNGSTVQSPEPSGKLDLQTPSWLNPYTVSASRAATAAYPICARPIQMTIGDPKTSFDSDQLPGAAFSTTANFGPAFTGSLGSLNVSTEADAIWNQEFGAGIAKKFFIGEVGLVPDGNPSAKTVTSFKNIRGHGPDSTTNQGSFYGASVARFGKFTGVANPALTDPLRVDQVSIALDSPVPQIKIPVNGKTVSIIPLSKSIGSCSPMTATQHRKGGWQPTGEISAFFVEQIANTETANAATGSSGNMNTGINGGRPYFAYRVSYADNDQGSDNEQDAVVRYEIQVTNTNQLKIGMEITAEATCMTMHQGYVISGTTNDGVYLDVGGNSGKNTKLGYYLDTAPLRSPGYAQTQGTSPDFTDIPSSLSRTTIAAPRVFSTGTGSNGEFVPHDMLWYAAKYGGASRDPTGAFNFKFKANKDPENYFLANNPSQLAAQMGQAFQKAASLSAATSSAVAGNGVRVGGGSFVYQAGYDTIKWGGDLSGFAVDSNGNVANVPTWQATTALPAPSARQIVLGRGGTSNAAITTASFSSLTVAEQTAFKDDSTFKYLLGVRTSEQSWVPSTGGTLRNRSSAVGDIVNSDPIYINTADFGYSIAGYDAFKTSSAPQLVGFGSNDGFYHLVSAITGVEKLAFLPSELLGKLSKLADPAYEHQYYVDGPAGFGHVKWGGAWKSVVAASLGAGGKSVFAINASSSSPSTGDVLWEYGNDLDLGNVTNKPIVGMLEDGTTPVVIVGNGLNSVNDKAALLVLNAKTGVLIKVCRPTDAANTTGNGLGSIAFVSTSNNGKINYVYGADYKGNIWRFDPNTTGCDTDKVFTAKNDSSQIQPITGEITLIKAPAGKSGYMVLFGTGSYLTTADPGTNQVQSLYGVWDDLSATSLTRAKLVAQTIITPSTVSGTRTTSSNGAWYEAPGNKKGWYFDLACTDATICQPGERSIAKPTLFGTGTSQRVFFLSMVPGTDPCKVGGGGWLTSFDPTSGGYVKGFNTIASNSTYISGVTPRGLFVVQRTATTNNKTTDILFVSVTISGGVVPNPPGTVSTGGLQLPGDGSGTGVIGLDISPPASPVPGFGTRRQVWRQIQ
jgi:type IV pilus assembly protein PilY1